MFHAYSVYGVTLWSDIALQLPSGAPEAEPFVRLQKGAPGFLAATREALGPPLPGEWGHAAALGDGAIYMHWIDWLEYVVSADGRTITYDPLCPGPVYSFEAYIANFAVSAAMIQQGEEPLHATVVEIGGRGVGLLGTSGAGKSSLAAYLLAKGARLVTDDMLRITIEGEQAFAQPGPLRLKLMEDSASIFMAGALRRGEWSPDSRKYLIEPPASRGTHGAVALSALFHLDGPAAGSGIAGAAVERLSGLELFKAISSAALNSRIGTQARLKRQFGFASRLGSLIPIYRLSYPRRYESLSEAATSIEQCIS